MRVEKTSLGWYTHSMLATGAVCSSSPNVTCLLSCQKRRIKDCFQTLYYQAPMTLSPSTGGQFHNANPPTNPSSANSCQASEHWTSGSRL
ncbi:hypothetical protein OPQ81_007201 [Rhizoctonia solani]|nr:hypothetical protein OPQ81_007201 [Rhizoctonia solani]